MEVLAILTVLAAGVLWYFLKPYWAVRKVPGPRALPVIGHLHLLAEYGPDVFSLLANRFGPIFRFHMGRQAVVIVANPELCKEVGIKKFKHIPNRSIPSPIASSPLHLNGLFFSRNARWSTMRNAILSVYQPSHLAKLIPAMQHLIESAIETLDPSTDLDFSDFSLKLATDVIGQAAFGFDFGLSHSKPNTEKNEQIRAFIDQHVYSTTQLKMDLSGSLSTTLGLLIPFLQNPVRTILKSIPGTTDSKLDRSNEALSRHLDEIVERRKKDRFSSNKSDFLSLVLDSEKNNFSSENIKAVTYEHLLAGSTTTSFTLTSVVYLVSSHSEVEKKVLKEIDEFGKKKVPTASDLRTEFSYLDSVIKEAMRFYTVSPLVARETSAHVSVGGYDLPEGTWVWLAIGALSKDPRNFPEPERFRPDRFDPSGEEEKGRHAYASIPFGIGPRSCVGQKFSIQEIKLSLIHLYRRFVFRVSPEMEEPPEMEYGLVMRFKHGVKVRPVERK